MTTPLQIIPADVRSFAQDQLGSAGGFMAAPAPPPPGDDPDDPTKQATGQFTDNVHRARTTLKARSDRHADGMTAAAGVLEAQDEQNAASISAVAPKDQMAMFTGAAKDLLGAGTGGIKDVLGIVTSTAQAGTQAFTAAAVGGVSAFSTAIPAALKAAGDQHPAAAAGPSAGAAPIASGGGSDKDRRDAAAETHAASSTQSPVLPDAGHDSGRAGYTHPDRDREDVTTVQPAGMPMPGSAMGGMGASASSPTTKAKTVRIVTGSESPPEEPATGPIDTAALQRAIARI